jgi:hypothetical protein
MIVFAARIATGTAISGRIRGSSGGAMAWMLMKTT